jgi:NAD(P)H-dependent glutamate synthase small subunit
VAERIGDWREIERPLPQQEVEIQATRCRDCGVPYCHSYGCPLANRIPDWNLMVAGKSWKQALDLLHAANNFPEITGRVCPALCESACTLSINMPAVTIRHIELQIVERGWEKGWIEPRPALRPTGKRVAIIGSGPAGLAAAQELARKGHAVTVYEKDDRIGGILRYGIPDFKLEKWVLDRRLEQLRAEGVEFETGVTVGTDLSARYLRRTFDAVLIAAGARMPRDLPVPGRGLEGIHFAMDFLSRQNRVNSGDPIAEDQRILAAGKNVLVVGGGDTGSDCVGVSRRQGAAAIYQMEILPRPPETRLDDNPWPAWPLILRTSTSHEEGCERLWSVTVKEFIGEGSLRAVRLARVEWYRDNGRQTFREIPGSEFEREVGLALLAMGFLHTEHGPLVTDLGLSTDSRGNLAVDESLMTSAPGIFAAGDSVSGASLVVRAIGQGRKAAEMMDTYLKREEPGVRSQESGEKKMAV